MIRLWYRVGVVHDSIHYIARVKLTAHLLTMPQGPFVPRLMLAWARRDLLAGVHMVGALKSVQRVRLFA